MSSIHQDFLQYSYPPSAMLEPDNPERFVLFPIPNEQKPIWDMYKKAVASFWTVEEVDLVEDTRHWLSLSENEQHFIKHVLAFFAASDGIVNENLLQNFSHEVQWPTARAFYGFQIMIENIHSEMYSLLLQTLVKDNAEFNKLRNALTTMPPIAQKAAWALKWCDPKQSSFAKRLVAFAVVEGIFFSGSFCATSGQERGKMPGLCFSNELISRDEGLHCDFACLLYSYLSDEEKLDTATVHAIVQEAVEIETNFICKALPVSLLGMNSDLMAQYIQFCADRLVQALDYPAIYCATNPFEWMDLISLQGKTNFFEKRVGEYAKANVGTTREELHRFSVDDDF